MQAQATITIAKKAQSETAGQQFGFTSNIPGGSTFNLTDDAAYIPLQDVGVGNNNKVWVAEMPPSGGGVGQIYHRSTGSTSWVALSGATGNRLDSDKDGNVTFASSGVLFHSDGVSTIGFGGNNIVDVGLSAGAIQFTYVLAGSSSCAVLNRYNNGFNDFTAFPNICGTRLDVAPDGAVWVIDGVNIYRITISGSTATVTNTYPGAYDDITVAADGTVWAVSSIGRQMHRLIGGLGGSFVNDPGSSGLRTSFGGISAGSDGDVPYLTQYAGYLAYSFTIWKVDATDGRWNLAR